MLDGGQATRYYLNQWWLTYWRIYASLGLSEFIWSTYAESKFFSSWCAAVYKKIMTCVLQNFVHYRLIWFYKQDIRIYHIECVAVSFLETPHNIHRLFLPWRRDLWGQTLFYVMPESLQCCKRNVIWYWAAWWRCLHQWVRKYIWMLTTNINKIHKALYVSLSWQ